MGTNDQIMEGGSSWLRGFNGRVKLVFPIIDPDLGYWYIIWKVNTTNRGLNFTNTLCTLCLWSWRFHWKSVVLFFLNILVTYSLMSWLLGTFRFAYLRARFMEKWVKAFQNQKGLGSKPGSWWPWGQISIKHSD